MIRILRGSIIHKEGNFVILDVGGTGYRISVAAETYAALPTASDAGREAKLWTHLAVRDTAMDLYGFLSKEDLDFFELLLTISGIGPKKAIGILSAASGSSVRKAIAGGDAAYLQKISGVGRKNAEKIIVELREKIGASEGDESLKEEREALEALESLGYTAREARVALEKIPSGAKTTSERIKAALTMLGK